MTKAHEPENNHDRTFEPTLHNLGDLVREGRQFWTEHPRKNRPIYDSSQACPVAAQRIAYSSDQATTRDK